MMQSHVLLVIGQQSLQFTRHFWPGEPLFSRLLEPSTEPLHMLTGRWVLPEFCDVLPASQLVWLRKLLDDHLNTRQYRSRRWGVLRRLDRQHATVDHDLP